MTQRNKGFTLIELTIVIVIIGVIGLSIIIGKNIVRSYKVKMVASEFNHYKTQLNLFRSKYDATPGDFSDGWNYWNTNCAPTANICNGNNDLNIDADEELMFWRHMFLANLVHEEYSGVLDGGKIISGKNIPLSKLGETSGHWIANDTVFNKTHNFIIFGADEGNDTHYTGTLTPSEAYSLDKKMDDGKPDNGQIFAGDGVTLPAGSCVTSAIAPAEYVTDKGEKTCILYFTLKK